MKPQYAATQWVLAVLLLCAGTATSHSQLQQGDVLGAITGNAHKYHGEFVDDLWGAGGSVSLFYAPLSRLSIETRFSLGEIRWKVTPSMLAAYPNYFGTGSEIGDPYPGTLTTIEPENTTRITSYDLLINYVLVPNIPASPFISAGVGMVDFHPTNDSEHSSLPNNIQNIYPRQVVSFPLGGGVMIPFSNRAGIMFRAEHRFVLSEYLDDFTVDFKNDAVTTLSIGLTYQFNEPRQMRQHRECWDTLTCDCCDRVRIVPCGYRDEIECHCREGHHCGWCSCCHCCCNNGGASAGTGGGSGGNGGGGTSGGGGGSGGGQMGDPGPMPPEPEPPREKFSKDIRFKLDTDEFDFSFPQTQANLDQLLDYMKSSPDGHEIIIEGHASGEGPPARNKVLSDLRAKKIRQWLIEKGISPDKIRGTVGYGSSMPLVKEPTPEEMKTMTREEIESIRAQNRRIEIYVMKDAYKLENDARRMEWERELKDWEDAKRRLEEEQAKAKAQPNTLGS